MSKFHFAELMRSLVQFRILRTYWLFFREPIEVVDEVLSGNYTRIAKPAPYLFTTFVIFSSVVALLDDWATGESGGSELGILEFTLLGGLFVGLSLAHGAVAHGLVGSDETKITETMLAYSYMIGYATAVIVLPLVASIYLKEIMRGSGYDWITIPVMAAWAVAFIHILLGWFVVVRYLHGVGPMRLLLADSIALILSLSAGAALIGLYGIITSLL